MGLKSDFVTIGMTPAPGVDCGFLGAGRMQKQIRNPQPIPGEKRLKVWRGVLKTKMLAGFSRNPLELFVRLGYH
jgi:hypothetical protein